MRVGKTPKLLMLKEKNDSFNKYIQPQKGQLVK